MKKFVICMLVGSLLLGSFAIAQETSKPDIDLKKVQEIQDFSVTIHATGSQGSGEIKTRDGINYVWTAAHVVDGLRKTRSIVDANGSTKTIVEFDDAKIVKEYIQDGRSVGRSTMDAEIVRYSDADNGEDLALLRVRKKNFVTASMQFYLEDKIPPVGTTLYHCGSLLGQIGSNSFTRGIMSQHGRVLSGVVYDQTTCAAFPGSSGGGVYLGDGRCVGMIVRGAGETFNLIVPSRRIRDWAKKVKVEFALDDSIPVPSEEDLWKTPVDGTNIRTPGTPKNAKNFPFLIHKIEE
ncbi:serine protease [Candidatus Parcubacteria bacterium]|nr:MAG: serine protease [Candidatus Parcubacteria bacterium]